jgi:FtsP/CotA-like multicopper oxidase with cupredoxin domain
VRKLYQLLFPVFVFSLGPALASAQSFRVQCPNSTITHPDPTNSGVNNSEPAYLGPTQFTKDTNGQFVVPTPGTVNGAIKCQQISGGDGYATMGDGTQTFLFAFGPLSGLADIAAGLPGTEPPNVFNNPWPGCASPTSGGACATPLQRGDPAMTDGATSGGSPGTVFPAAFTWNGAVGLTPDISSIVTITDIVVGALPAPATNPGCPAPGPTTVTVFTNAQVGIPVGSQVTIANDASSTTPAGFLGTFLITCAGGVTALNPSGFNSFVFTYNDTASGLVSNTGSFDAGTASAPALIDGHVDPRPIIDVGVMNGSIPAPLMAFDEDDEFFLTLTNVGMIMRPDLFEQHTVHFHGYPNASSFYDGVPDASVAINIGGSFTYYYLAPDAGTYFWHCHITPPEHLQMGMVGQLYVRPRQDRVPAGNSLYAALQAQNSGVDLRTTCNPATDILCSAVTPATNTVNRATSLTLCSGVASTSATTPNYVYNDGDGSTCYDVEYPLQMHGFDPNFHFVGMTFNPEAFVDMKDKYFLLNGRSYPDTVGTAGGQTTLPIAPPGPQATVSSDGQMHYSQPLPAIINIPVGGKAALRLVNLSVSEYHTIASLGVPMKVAGWNAKLLRDQAGNNTEYYTNSITLGGGESADVILDASNITTYQAGQVFYLYTPQLDHLSNDAENFGGLMTEVHICNSVDASSFGNTCK